MAAQVPSLIKQLSFGCAVEQSDNNTAGQHPEKSNRILQNFFLIWLDSNINTSDNTYHESIKQLQCVANTINTFSEIDDCIDFLTEIDYQRVFMIVSGVFTQYIVPLIHDILQSHSIYLVGDNVLIEKQWLKVKDISTHFVSICHSLQQATREYDQNLIPISFLSTNNQLHSNLNQLDQSFMYSQLLKEIVLEMNYNVEVAVRNLFEYCRGKKDLWHSGTADTLDKLEREYRLHSPVWWYTSQSFMYSMLNHALRSQEIDEILLMGFFVKDLHQNIEQLYSEQRNKYGMQPFTVYRGQGLREEDFEKIVRTKGGLLAFNNFLSTSTDRQVAFAFAESVQNLLDSIAIFFEITIDMSIASSPFANLEGVGQYNAENEILFSTHLIFRIGDIQSIDGNSRFWQVKLALTDDNDKDLRDVTDRIREETRTDSTGVYRLGKFLIKSGDYDRASHIYKALLDSASDDESKQYVYAQLALINDNEGNYTDAVAFYEKCIEVRQSQSSIDDQETAALYNNIGKLRYNMGEYSAAFQFYQKALDIKEKQSVSDHLLMDLAYIYNNFALVYTQTDHYSKALEFYEKSLHTYQNVLPPYHPDLAQLYNNIGMVCHKMEQYTEASESYEKGLEIGGRTLPPGHSNLIATYNNIGKLYEDMSEWSKALSYYEKASESCRIDYLSNRSSLADLCNQIGLLYTTMGEYSKALPYHEEALKIRKQILPPHNLDLAVAYDSIGSTWCAMGDCAKALHFHEKALEIARTLTAPNNLFLAICHTNTGNAYLKMNQPARALLLYKEALELRQNILPPNHPDIGLAYNNIGCAHFVNKDYSEAISCLKRALEIYQRKLPWDHHNLLQSYDNIGTLYYETKAYEKALPYCEKALAIRQRILDPHHPKLASSYNNIGALYANIQEYPKALSHYSRALEIAQITLTENHLGLSNYLHDIGLVHQEMGEHSEALIYLRRALHIAQQALPSDHPQLQLLIRSVEFSEKIVNDASQNKNKNDLSK